MHHSFLLCNIIRKLFHSDIYPREHHAWSLLKCASAITFSLTVNDYKSQINMNIIVHGLGDVRHMKQTSWCLEFAEYFVAHIADELCLTIKNI